MWSIVTSCFISFVSVVYFYFNSINPYWLPKSSDIEHVTYAYFSSKHRTSHLTPTVIIETIIIHNSVILQACRAHRLEGNIFKYGTVKCFHHLRFTIVNTLGFSVTTNCLLAMDFSMDTVNSNHHKVFLSAITLYSPAQPNCVLYHSWTETPELRTLPFINQLLHFTSQTLSNCEVFLNCTSYFSVFFFFFI
jgi:hypothetical protein